MSCKQRLSELISTTMDLQAVSRIFISYAEILDYGWNSENYFP